MNLQYKQIYCMRPWDSLYEPSIQTIVWAHKIKTCVLEFVIHIERFLKSHKNIHAVWIHKTNRYVLWDHNTYRCFVCVCNTNRCVCVCVWNANRHVIWVCNENRYIVWIHNTTDMLYEPEIKQAYCRSLHTNRFALWLYITNRFLEWTQNINTHVVWVDSANTKVLWAQYTNRHIVWFCSMSRYVL